MIIKCNDLERIYTGKLLKDPNMSTFGKNNYPKASMAIRFGRGDNDIIHVDAKFELAERCRGLKGGDIVLAVGNLASYETKEGQKRWFLDAGFIASAGSPRTETATTTEPFLGAGGFTGLEDDALNLPFD